MFHVKHYSSPTNSKPSSRHIRSQMSSVSADKPRQQTITGNSAENAEAFRNSASALLSFSLSRKTINHNPSFSERRNALTISVQNPARPRTKKKDAKICQNINIVTTLSPRLLYNMYFGFFCHGAIISQYCS